MRAANIDISKSDCLQCEDRFTISPGSDSRPAVTLLFPCPGFKRLVTFIFETIGSTCESSFFDVTTRGHHSPSSSVSPWNQRIISHTSMITKRSFKTRKFTCWLSFHWRSSEIQSTPVTLLFTCPDFKHLVPVIFGAIESTCESSLSDLTTYRHHPPPSSVSPQKSVSFLNHRPCTCITSSREEPFTDVHDRQRYFQAPEFTYWSSFH